MKSLKLITTTVVLAFAVNANAQELDSNANLKNILDWFYAPLDTSSYITSGLFMDKVGMDSSLFWFRNSEIDSISDIDDWYQLYYSSYNAQTQNHQNLQHLDSVVKRVEYYRNKGEIHVLGLLFDYNYIDSNAFDNGILDTADGQV